MVGAIRLAQFRYRREIDGLRAIAVLGVLIYHYFPSKLPGGFVGVDVFFVVSGYLISGIVLSDVESGSFSYATFYSRRIRRIFPALITVLAAVLLAGIVLLLPDELNDLSRQITASALFSANILFWHDSGYFDTSSDLKPLLHIWSLGVEEQFYILWPLCLVLLTQIKTIRLHVIAAVSLCSFLCAVVMVRAYPIATFFLPFSRVWELMIGSALAMITAKPDGFLSWRIARETAPLVGLSMIAGSAAIINPQTPFPGFAALLPTFGTALVIAGDGNSWLSRTLLSQRLLVFTGLISYPLYLWHWPLLAFYRIGTMSVDLSIVSRVALIAISMGLSIATYYVIERPVRTGGKANITRALATSMAGMAAVALMVSTAFVGLLDRSHLDMRQLSWNYVENAECTAKYPFRHRRSWWFCMANSSRPPTLILLGDSHANQIYPGLSALREMDGESILSIGACNDAERIHSDFDDVGENPCAGRSKEQQDAFIHDLVIHNPSIHRAILASMWPRFSRQGAELEFWSGKPAAKRMYSVVPGEQSLSAAQMYRAGLDRRITFLESRGISVVLVMPTPHLPYDIRRCIDRPFQRASYSCAVPEKDEIREAGSFRPIADWLKLRHPGLLVHYPMPAFCTSGVCRFNENGKLYLRDLHHLSELGSEKFAKDFAARTWRTWNAATH